MSNVNTTQSNNKIIVLGSDGKYGKHTLQRFTNLQGISFKDPQVAISEVKEILQNNNNAILAVMVAAQFQVDVIKKIIALIGTIDGASPTIVSINSVQGEVPEQLNNEDIKIPKGTTLVMTHPHFVHSDVVDTKKQGKKFHFTFAETGGIEDPIEQETIHKLVRKRLERWIRENTEENEIKFFDFIEAAEKLGDFKNGAELHDTLASIGQALPHMLRRLINDEDLFNQHFVSIAVSADLSESIVEQNPVAREVYAELQKDLLDKNTQDFIPELIKRAITLIEEYNTKFKGVSFEIVNAMKTPKFEELQEELVPKK